jgi:hypothetical protein
LVLDLISILDGLKFDKDEEVRNAAHDVDEKISFNKNPKQDLIKGIVAKEADLKRTE